MFWLSLQYDVTLKEGLRESRADSDRAALYQQLQELADRILEGYTAQLEGSQQPPSAQREIKQQYEETRTALIMPLGELGRSWSNP